MTENKVSAPVKFENCLNCDHPLKEGDRFCRACGQEVRETSESFGMFVRHFLNDYFTFDSKIVRSFGPLLFKPGFLTSEFLVGRRVRYIPPLRMYIFISIVFFLMLSLKSDSGITLTEEARFWNRFFEVHLPRLFFLLLPLFALILFALNARMKNSGYVRHFVFSLHFHAFIFLSALLYLMVSEAFDFIGIPEVNAWLGLLLLLVTSLYLFLALRKVYQKPFVVTLVRMITLLILYSGVMGVVIFTALLVMSAG